MLGAAPGNSIVDGPFEHAEDGAVWELVATVTANGSCSYSQLIPTTCDSSASNPCPNYFFISAVTGTPGQHYDSHIEVGYSMNNGAGSFPVDIEIDANLALIGSFSVSPNPSRSELSLEFEVKEKGWVVAEMYDVLGRRVGVLLDRIYSAGIHRFSLETQEIEAGLAPGIYFVRISSSDRDITKKFILMR